MDAMLSRRARLRAKYLQRDAALRFLWAILRAGLLIGLCYVILYPFFTKAINAFKTYDDLIDPTVRFLPKHLTTEYVQRALQKMQYPKALLNTVLLSTMVGAVQTIVCAVVGYGFAKFRFRGNGALFFFVILMLVVPPQTILVPLFTKFRFFLGSINLIDTPLPMLIMGLTCTGFKNGLYVFLFRQFFRNVPTELNEAASLDGYGPYRTFLHIMIPTAVPMLTTVFLLSFSWQWTDTLYNSLFFKNTPLLANTVSAVAAGELRAVAGNLTNAAALLAVLPLALVYIFAQKAFVGSIDRAGLVG